MKKVTAKAPVNIALIKYWGKENKEEVRPYNSSISITLDNLYTITTIEESNAGFEFILNNHKQSPAETNKVLDFLTQFASIKEISKIKVASTNYVPTSAGLASSASGYSALAVAANQFFNTNFSFVRLCEVTRKGSGSACRSLLGGFVAWERQGQVYEVISSRRDWVVISVIINKSEKKISSRVAMERTVETSPFFSLWVTSANQDFLAMKAALKKGNIQLIGELTEKSARLMHSSMLASSPPILYFNEDSLKVWELVESLRAKRVYAYATMDAGPNVKILSIEKDLSQVEFALNEQGFLYYVSRIGEGAHILEK